jgi:hypothetical protein
MNSKYIPLTSKNFYYCKICCDGFSENDGDLRSVYTYLINNKNTKDYFLDKNNKYKFNIFAVKLPENWDDYDEDDDGEFSTKDDFIKHIKQLLSELSNDPFYDEIKVILPIHDIELINELKLNNIVKDIDCSRYWDDTKFIGYYYPLNKCLPGNEKQIWKCYNEILTTIMQNVNDAPIALIQNLEQQEYNISEQLMKEYIEEHAGEIKRKKYNYLLFQI